MKRGKHRVPREVWSRFRIFSAVVVLLLSVLAVRLAQMQLLDGERYAELALGNAVKQRVVEPPRGRIYDRHGRFLVDNEPTYTVTVTPRFLTEDSLPLLADLLGVSDSEAVRDSIFERPSASCEVSLTRRPEACPARHGGAIAPI